MTTGILGEAVFTIYLLENLPLLPFIWPDHFETILETTTTRKFGTDEKNLIMSRSGEQISMSRSVARLQIEGITFYVCALKRREGASRSKPGCILYDGIPDIRFRKKVRTALSFALGTFLVELGHSVYDRQWDLISAVARSAYSLDNRAFDLIPQPLAPLGVTYRNEIDHVHLTRFVSSFVSAYDDLDLANLSWAYWHACTATAHIAPVHFGAAIEALQRTYLAKHPGIVAETLLCREQWKVLRSQLSAVVDRGAPESVRSVLISKITSLNGVDQRPLMHAVLQVNGLSISEEEGAAWRRRNKAAHGMPVPEGEELAAIRDMKLLKGLFHRLLLRIAGASDTYIDYVSAHHPHRRLEDAPKQ